MAIRARKSGLLSVRRIASVLPRTLIPEMCRAFPAAYDVSPTMSLAKPSAGDFIFGFRVRSIVSLKVCAVTGAFEGGEKRKPFRIVNVYVFPSAERFGKATATSGTS